MYAGCPGEMQAGLCSKGHPSLDTHAVLTRATLLTISPLHGSLPVCHYLSHDLPCRPQPVWLIPRAMMTPRAGRQTRHMALGWPEGAWIQRWVGLDTYMERCSIQSMTWITWMIWIIDVYLPAYRDTEPGQTRHMALFKAPARVGWRCTGQKPGRSPDTFRFYCHPATPLYFLYSGLEACNSCPCCTWHV